MGGGITFTDALTIVFVVLKLTHVIDWSWWLVLLPYWGTFLFYVVFVIIADLLDR